MKIFLYPLENPAGRQDYSDPDPVDQSIPRSPPLPHSEPPQTIHVLPILPILIPPPFIKLHLIGYSWEFRSGILHSTGVPLFQDLLFGLFLLMMEIIDVIPPWDGSGNRPVLLSQTDNRIRIRFKTVTGSHSYILIFLHFLCGTCDFCLPINLSLPPLSSFT